MKTFWLFVLIVNFSSILTNLIAFDVTGDWWHVPLAVGAASLAGYSHHKLDRVGP